jgi:hypothetical protein
VAEAVVSPRQQRHHGGPRSNGSGEVQMYRARSTPPTSAAVARSVLFSAVLAFASAATAFGTMAIYRLAIARMAVQQLKVGRLEIDELTVRRLNVLEKT